MNDIDEMVDCPACHTTQAWEEVLLGALGQMAHYRCRYCGTQWNERMEDDPLKACEDCA